MLAFLLIFKEECTQLLARQELRPMLLTKMTPQVEAEAKTFRGLELVLTSSLLSL